MHYLKRCPPLMLHRDFSLLSFGEEAVEDEEEITRASSVSHTLLSWSLV